MTFRLIIENKDGKLRDYSDVKRNTMNKKKVVRNAKTGKFAAKSKAKTSPAKHVEETVGNKKPNADQLWKQQVVSHIESLELSFRENDKDILYYQSKIRHRKAQNYVLLRSIRLARKQLKS